MSFDFQIKWCLEVLLPQFNVRLDKLNQMVHTVTPEIVPGSMQRIVLILVPSHLVIFNISNNSNRNILGTPEGNWFNLLSNVSNIHRYIRGFIILLMASYISNCLLSDMYFWYFLRQMNSLRYGANPWMTKTGSSETKGRTMIDFPNQPFWQKKQRHIRSFSLK